MTHSIRSQALDIHLLGLSLQGSFVGNDGLHDLRVEEDDDDHGKGIVQDEGIQDIALVVPVLS